VRESGQAALNYAVLNVTDCGCNIVSVPQLYGTTHTLFAHILAAARGHGALCRSDQAEAIAKLIDDKTRAVFCESVGNPAGNICDIEALARVAHVAAFRSSSTTPSRRRSCCARSITAPTSWSIR
jgi:O-acetylhomoserine (thiol)-lyase